MAKILVAEDSPTQAAHIRGLLEAAGFEVRTAPDGLAALESVRHDAPDAVLTDLNMPQLGGLELVVALRRELPNVPVVLMTAFGNEEIAARALESGAASYVPKRNLAQDVVETLRDVIEVARTGREDAQLSGYLTEIEARFALPSVAPPTMSVVAYVQEVMAQMRLGDATDRVRLGVALDTAVQNLREFGNLEFTPGERNASFESDATGHAYFRLLEERAHHAPYAGRNIHVHIRVTPREVHSTLRHEGAGANVRASLEVADADELGIAPGWLLINSFVDEVRLDETGTELELVRRFDA
jgi:CheY-like chemotaxis protein